MSKRCYKFSWLSSYYRIFIEKFTKIASPLFKLLTKDCEFISSLDCQKAFETLKENISKAPILRGPNWKLHFHISTNAFDTTLGVVLGQKDLIPYAIYYTNKKLTPTTLNYTIIEKEFLVGVHAINKFRHYITRKENTVVDFLSRIQNDNNDILVEHNFPDEYIFTVSIKSHWFANISNYLATGNLPTYLSPKEKIKVIQNSASYSWINEELYKTSPDIIIWRCVREDEVPNILKVCHDEPSGGHFVHKRTTYKVLILGYYWPSLFKDAKEYFKRCGSCRRIGKLVPSNEMPLQPQVLI